MSTSRSFVNWSVPFLAAVAPFALSASAHAATCGDQTCPKNWECRTETAPSPGIACAQGAECEVPEPTTIEFCSPLPCSSDADCASDMICYSETRTECDDVPPCAKGGDCVAPADGDCKAVTQSACVPRYVPPCEADADCGGGFTCEALEECSCAGSGGTGSGSTPSSGSGGGSEPAPSDDAGSADPALPQDGGAAPTPPDAKMAPDAGADAPPEDGGTSSCTCTPTKEKACKLTVVACSATSDCPAGWTCEDNPSGSCWASSDGSSGCDIPDPAKLCAPPYAELLGGAGRAEDAGGELGTPSASPPKGSSDPGAASGGPNGNGASAGDDDEVVTHESSSDGCSVASAPRTSSAGYGLVALGLVGLFGARRRRR